MSISRTMLNPFSVKYLIGVLTRGKESGLTCFLCIDMVFTSGSATLRLQTIVNLSMLVKTG